MVRHVDIVHELTDWIRQNINKPLRIDDIAEKSGYSKWHLQRMFHRVMSVSLGNYIRDQKLRLAAKDLIYGKDSVITISVKYGYESQQSFTRTFSKKYHMPPATFRRMNQHAFSSDSGYMN